MVKQQKQPEKPALAIIKAVHHHSNEVGIHTLALILKGSKSKLLIKRKLYNSKFFGAIFYQSIEVIEEFIKQLITKNLIQIRNLGIIYSVPVITLTTIGKEALDQGKDIPLETIRKTKPIILTESIQSTIELFNQLKNIESVATKKSLAQSTIWKHLIDAVKLGKLEPKDILSKEKIELITMKYNRLKPQRLKELKEALPHCSYEEIRCVVAVLQ